MPNRMLTKQEVHEIFMEQMRSACGQDVRKQRAYVYDLQTQMGGFPASQAERDHYIETGKPLKSKKMAGRRT